MEAPPKPTPNLGAVGQQVVEVVRDRSTAMLKPRRERQRQRQGPDPLPIAPRPRGNAAPACRCAAWPTRPRVARSSRREGLPCERRLPGLAVRAPSGECWPDGFRIGRRCIGDGRPRSLKYAPMWRLPWSVEGLVAVAGSAAKAGSVTTAAKPAVPMSRLRRVASIAEFKSNSDTCCVSVGLEGTGVDGPLARPMKELVTRAPALRAMPRAPEAAPAARQDRPMPARFGIQRLSGWPRQVGAMPAPRPSR